MNKIVIASIFSAFFVQSSFANTLTVYAYPPKNEIDWKSPKSAIFSFIGTEITRILSPVPLVEVTSEQGDTSSISRQYKSTMGHTIAHISCQSSEGYFDKWTSFSGQNFAEVDKDNLFNKKLGTEILFYDYIDATLLLVKKTLNV